MSQGRALPAEQRLRRQRQRVLRAAAKVFSRLGFRAATMDDIAVELRATRGLVYYHFKSKAEIFYELHMASLEELIERFHRRVDPSADAVTGLRQAIEAHVEFVCQRLTLARVTARMMEVQGARDFPRRYRDLIVAYRDRYEALWRTILEEGVDSGVFRPVDIAVAEKNMLGALNWLCFWYRPRGRLSPSALTAAVADTLISGLVSPGAAAGPSALARMKARRAARSPGE